MGRFPRTVTLTEAYRRILRTRYPEAGDISVWSGADDETKKLLARLVAREKIRLRGVLHPSSPLQDIDPAHAKVGLLDIFAGELRVFQTNFGKHKVVQIYHQVHCYEADVDHCVTELRLEPKPRPKRTSEPDFVKFVNANLNGGVRPTEEEFIATGKTAGIVRPRKDFRNALRNAYGPARPGRPNNSPKLAK